MKLSMLKQKLIQKNELNFDSKTLSTLKEEYKQAIKESQEKEEVQKIQNFNLYNKNIKELSKYQQSPQLTTLMSNHTILEDEREITSNSNLNQIKIIGITGSKGKSSTAYIVHEYLKSIGYNSVLYSSIKIDSPASYISSNDPCEIALQSEQMLLNIIEEVEAIKADFLILEINESAIQKGLTEEIPFAVRALTNLNPKHNEEQYSPEEYVRIKQSFFQNIEENDNCTCVFGLTEGISRDDFNHLIGLNNKPKVTFGTKYTCERNNADYTNLDCLLYELQSDLQGIKMKIRVKENLLEFQSKILFSHNALNFTCATAILEALNVLDVPKFNQCIERIEIPGREEIIKVGNRTIMIGLSVIPVLEEYAKLRNNEKIKVVIGSVGNGFISWDTIYSSPLYLKNRSINRKYAMEYIKKYADFVYLTSNDPAAENPLLIAQEMQNYLNNEIPSTIVVDREQAIRKALTESEPSDMIYLSGRGNRSIFCDTSHTVKIFKDKDIVVKVCQELGWK